MRAKKYNKKIMLSLVLLPVLACSVATKTVNATVTVPSGSTVTITGTDNTEPYAGDGTDVTVILDTDAQLNVDNYSYYSAIYLQDDSTVTLNAGSQLSITGSGSYGLGILVANSFTDSTTTGISLDNASISAAGSIYAAGIYVDNSYVDGSITNISLTNGSSISATANEYAAGIYIGSDQDKYSLTDPVNSIALDASSISVAAGSAYGIYVADGGFTNGNGQTTVALANASTLNVAATDQYAYASGIILDIDGAADVLVGSGSSLSVTADAEGTYAEAYAVGVNVDSLYSQVLFDTATLDVAATAVSDDGQAFAVAEGIDVSSNYSGTYPVSLDASTINVDAAAQAYGSAGVYGFGILAEGGSSLVEVNNSAVNVTLGAASQTSRASAFGAGVGAFDYSYNGMAGMLIEGSSVTLDVAASGQYDADARVYGLYAGAEGVAVAVMDNATLDVTVAASSQAGRASAGATAAGAQNDYWSYYDGYGNTGFAYVVLNQAAVTLDVSATAAQGAYAEGSGVVAEGGYGVILGIDSTVNVAVSATSGEGWTDASATGFEVMGVAGSYVDFANVTLTIDAAATQTGESYGAAWAGARGAGVYSWNGAAYLSADNLTMDVNATATSAALRADARAEGLNVFSDSYTVVGLDTAVLNVDAVADSYAGSWAGAEGISVRGWSGADVTLNSVVLDVSATSATTGSDYGIFYPVGTESQAVQVSRGPSGGTATTQAIRVDSYYGDAGVSLVNADVLASSAASSTYGSADGYAVGIGAWTGWYAGGDVAISLLDSSLGVATSATGSSYADADASGIMGRSGGDVIVDLQNSNLSVSAVAAAADDYSRAGAWADGIRAYSDWGSGDYATLSLENAAVTVDAAATAGNNAWAFAEGLSTYSSLGTSITLNSTTLDVRAAAESQAPYGAGYPDNNVVPVGIARDTNATSLAIGADSYNGAIDISLVNADVSATASGSSLYDSAEGQATGIDVWNGWWSGNGVSIELAGSSLAVSGSATASGYAEGYAYGIDVRSGGDVAINLSNSSLGVSAAAESTESWAGAEVVGIYAGAEGSVAVTMDNAVVAVDAVASGHYAAWAQADGVDIDAGWYADLDLDTVDLNVAATASASNDYAYAFSGASGIDASTYWYGGGDISVSLASVALDVVSSASVSGDHSYAGSFAAGSNAATGKYGYSSVSVSDSSLTVLSEATASGAFSGAEGWAGGIRAATDSYLGGYGLTSIDLGNTSLLTTASAMADSFASAIAYGLSAEGNRAASVTLDNSALTTTAEAVATGDAAAYGASAYAIGIDVRSEGGPVMVGSVETSAVAPSVIAPYGTMVNLADSAVTTLSTATADADSGYAMSAAAGMTIETYGDVAVSLDNSSITAIADADGSAEGGGAAGLAINPLMDSYGYGGSAMIDLVGSTIAASAAGIEGGVAYGLLVNNMLDTTINVDIDSSVTAQWAVFSNDGNVTLNNSGLVDGRVLVQNLSNSSSGVLHASVSTQSEVFNGGVNDDDSSFFTATGSAVLEDGSTLSILVEDDLGFTSVGEVAELYMIEAGSGDGNWAANDGAYVTIVQDLYDSPILSLTYSDSSNANNFIVDATLLTREASGISRNAHNAVVAATADGLLDFSSNPEDWVPDASGVSIAGTRLLLKSNVFNIEGRLSALKGMSSGDTPADQGVWINLLYSSADKDREGFVDGYEADTTGVIVGYDRQISPETALGFAFTYAVTDAETDAGEDYDIDELLLTAYGDYETRRWFGEAQLSYGWGDVDGERFMDATRLTSSYDSDVLYVRLLAGQHFYASDSNWVFSPLASLDYAKIGLDKYTEKGEAFALRVDPEDYDSLNLGVGIRAANQGELMTPELRLIAYYDLIGDEIETKSTFVGGATPFKTKGSDADRFSWDVGAAVTFGKADSPMSFKIGYDLVGSEDYTSHNFNGKLRYEF